MTFFDWWWPVFWLGFGFIVVELIAWADKKPGGTLSEWVWEVYILPRRRRRLSHFVFGAFWAALTLHFFAQTSVVPVAVFGAFMALPVVWWWKEG